MFWIIVSTGGSSLASVLAVVIAVSPATAANPRALLKIALAEKNITSRATNITNHVIQFSLNVLINRTIKATRMMIVAMTIAVIDPLNNDKILSNIDLCWMTCPVGVIVRLASIYFIREKLPAVI